MILVLAGMSLLLAHSLLFSVTEVQCPKDTKLATHWAFLPPDDSDWESIHEDYLLEEVGLSNVDATIAYANLLLENDKIDEAELMYRKAAEKSAIAWFNLGLLYHQRGLLDEAEAFYKEATILDEDLEQAHLNLGVLQYNKGALDESEATFIKAARLDGLFDFKTFYNLAIIYCLKNDSAKAERFMARSVLKTMYSNLLDAMNKVNDVEPGTAGIEFAALSDDYQALHRKASKMLIDCKRKLKAPFDLEGPKERTEL